MQVQQMKNRDKRTRLMSELLANIRRFVTGNATAVLHKSLSVFLASNYMHGSSVSPGKF